MDYNFTEMKISHLWLNILVGVALLFLFYVVNNYVIPLLKNKKEVSKNWLKLQIITWLMYLGILFVSLFKANMLITSIFTLIIISLGFNFWKNVFAGIIIKFTNQFEIGEVISTDFVKGELKNIHLSQSELINDKGELVIIPNKKIREAVLTHYYKKSNVQIHSFKVPISDNMTIENLYQLAINCPYISSNQKVTVKIKKDNFIINVSIIDTSFVSDINNYF